MTREEIALQLTLKSIEKIHTEFYRDSLYEDTIKFSNQVIGFYNNVYENLKIDATNINGIKSY